MKPKWRGEASEDGSKIWHIFSTDADHEQSDTCWCEPVPVAYKDWIIFKHPEVKGDA